PASAASSAGAAAAPAQATGDAGSSRVLGESGSRASGRLAGAAPASGEGAAAERSASPLQRQAIDPRSLLEQSAQREEPRVIVSIVSPSARPLSSSDRASSALRDGAGGLDGGSSRAGDAGLGDDTSRRSGLSGGGMGGGLSSDGGLGSTR
ncbi:MAG: hypothetical protein AB1689_15600, partial [Thermodesulfobacteriota bacterium]